VLLNYFVLEEGETLHEWAGYLAAALVVARIVWGFIGSRHARFSDFFPTPGRLWHHLQAMRSGRPEHHWGHNPLGALMMFLLMGLVLALGVTGWMQGTDAYFGEEWLQELHEQGRRAGAAAGAGERRRPRAQGAQGHAAHAGLEAAPPGRQGQPGADQAGARSGVRPRLNSP